jgi:hypothetical protein
VLEGLIGPRLADALEHRAHRLSPAVAQQAEQVAAKRVALRNMREADLERFERQHRAAAYRTPRTSTRPLISIPVRSQNKCWDLQSSASPPVVTEQPIGVPQARRNCRPTHRESGACGCARSLAVLLGRHRNQDPFLGLAPANADVRIVDFDPSRQPVASRPDHRPPQLMQPRPRGLVISSPSTCCRPMALGSIFWLLTHHMARNHVGSGVRVSLKIVPGATGRLTVTGCAVEKRTHRPRFGPAAFRTAEAGGTIAAAPVARHASALRIGARTPRASADYGWWSP